MDDDNADVSDSGSDCDDEKFLSKKQQVWCTIHLHAYKHTYLHIYVHTVVLGNLAKKMTQQKHRLLHMHVQNDHKY